MRGRTLKQFLRYFGRSPEYNASPNEDGTHSPWLQIPQVITGMLPKRIYPPSRRQWLLVADKEFCIKKVDGIAFCKLSQGEVVRRISPGVQRVLLPGGLLRNFTKPKRCLKALAKTAANSGGEVASKGLGH